MDQALQKPWVAATFFNLKKNQTSHLFHPPLIAAGFPTAITLQWPQAPSAMEGSEVQTPVK